MIKDLIAKKDGSIATMTALLLCVLVASVAFTVDYANAVRVKIEAQRITDAATLIAARHLRDTGDRRLSIKRAEEYATARMSNIRVEGVTHRFRVFKNENTRVIQANGEMSVEAASYVVGMGLPEVMRSDITSQAKLTELPQDLYLVLIVDSSGSMGGLIASVKDAALDLEQEVRDALLERGVEIGRVYVKVAFFGDLRFDPFPDAWNESPVYNLGDDVQATAFRDFVAAQPIHFGYDTPESAPAAIAHFLTAPLPAELDPDLTVQAIVAWSDAPGLPLDHPGLTDDITVNLYKTHGELGTSGAYLYPTDFPDYQNVDVAAFDEDTEFDADARGGEASPPAYGCCSSLWVMEDHWRRYGTIQLERRMLGLIVPELQSPWPDMATWPNVTVKDYTTPTASGILDDVVDSLSNRYSPLVMTR